MEWRTVDTQADLDRLDNGVCWEDAAVLESYATPALARGLPSDANRSGFELPNVYVLVDDACHAGDGAWLELAFIHCEWSGHYAFRGLDLRGRVDSLRRVELRDGEGETTVRCARLAYRRGPARPSNGLFYASPEYWSNASAT